MSAAAVVLLAASAVLAVFVGWWTGRYAWRHEYEWRNRDEDWTDVDLCRGARVRARMRGAGRIAVCVGLAFGLSAGWAAFLLTLGVVWLLRGGSGA